MCLLFCFLNTMMLDIDGSQEIKYFIPLFYPKTSSGIGCCSLFLKFGNNSTLFIFSDNNELVCHSTTCIF
jgi:hypothetical protein